MLRKKIALVVGAGDFLGASIAKKFAKEGFLAVVTRRRGDLTKLTRDINSFGGEAYPFHSDARNEEQVVELMHNIEKKIGQIDILIYNVGGNVRYKILETSSRVYRKVWEMCAFAGFLNSKEVLKYMIPRKKGTIKKLFPKEFEQRGSDGVLNPMDIAELYWNIYKQPKSAWSFETDIRPYNENW